MTMETNQRPKWGEQLAEEASSTDVDKRGPRRLLRTSARAVGGRLGDIRRNGIRPVLAEAAAQIRPASRAELLERYPKPSEEQIRHQLEGNLCRCTGYHNIVKAIQWAADTMAAKK